MRIFSKRTVRPQDKNQTEVRVYLVVYTDAGHGYFKQEFLIGGWKTKEPRFSPNFNLAYAMETRFNAEVIRQNIIKKNPFYEGAVEMIEVKRTLTYESLAIPGR